MVHFYTTMECAPSTQLCKAMFNTAVGLTSLTVMPALGGNLKMTRGRIAADACRAKCKLGRGQLMSARATWVTVAG
jgi:hypothetical protein